VAVKRLLKDFVSVASHEVSLLQESDDHPNVIRYFYKESQENFHYIALELCPTSLYELIDTPSAFPTLINNFDPIKALKQMTRGLAHLHKLKIVHRDLKPQNILVATTPGPRPGDAPVVRLVISDFGLCKKLDLDESSFLQSTKGGGNHAPGSFGYRAPEVLRGEVDANDLVNTDGSPSGTQNGSSSVSSRSASSSSTTTVAAGEVGRSSGRKLTRAIDIFSIGCIFYFVLTMGEHPFGSRYEREINILNGKIGLDGLDVMTEGKHEAKELIASMCGADARNRCAGHFAYTQGKLVLTVFALQPVTGLRPMISCFTRSSGLPRIHCISYVTRVIVSRSWSRRMLFFRPWKTPRPKL
jgi:serine/threonine-protein kinase/endoribonuclease IRE1